jgi:hypothetical protein
MTREDGPERCLLRGAVLEPLALEYLIPFPGNLKGNQAPKLRPIQL